MQGLFRKRKQNHTNDLQDRPAIVIAKKILYLQKNWADYMASIFKRLSAKRQVFVLCAIGLSILIWCVLLVTGSIRSTVSIHQGILLNNQIKQPSTIPTDSLMIMEHIYKSFKKTR